MIVCHCHAVTDRDIRKVVQEEGARTCGEIRRACKAGGDCGGCCPHVHMILQGVHRDGGQEQERAAG